MTFVCKTCRTGVDWLCNGECGPCHEATTTAWRKRMAIRQDPAQFDMARLLEKLLAFHWMHECEIVTDWMPPHPQTDTRPTCVVRYRYANNDDAVYLRYSAGPRQGFFWDIYGDAMLSPELAVVAISQAPPPPKVDSVIPL